MFLPGVLPSVWLSPNRGERKAGRVPQFISEAKRTLRGDVCQGLLADESVRAIAEPFPRAHLVLTLRWYKRKHGSKVYRPSDSGNACYALKAAIDGITDARLIYDDDYIHVPLLTTMVERVGTFEEEGIGITVIELEGEAG